MFVSAVAAMAMDLCSLAEWKELEAHYKEAKEWHMREMFKDDTGRFDKFRYRSLYRLCGGFWCVFSDSVAF